MTTLERELLIHYDRQIVQRICQKYGFSPMKALESFIHSQTYGMLRDPELAMTDFSPAGIFDMWEVEQITGDPRDSLYLRRDEVDA